MNRWILSPKLQVWIQVAQRDNRGNLSAFNYCANTVVNTLDSKVEFVRKGSRGFAKLRAAYLDEISVPLPVQVVFPPYAELE